jgi:hypothetical protein
LTFDRSDPLLKKAFEDFGLDPKNPFDWRKLIIYFAAAHYASKGRGAPRKWTEDRMCQFLSDFLRTRERYPKGLLEDIWKSMKKDKSLAGQYNIPFETWRKQRSQAVKWARTFRADHRKQGSPRPTKLPGI